MIMKTVFPQLATQVKSLVHADSKERQYQKVVKTSMVLQCTRLYILDNIWGRLSLKHIE